MIKEMDKTLERWIFEYRIPKQHRYTTKEFSPK